MQGLKHIYVTERSVNVKKEFDNYTWQQDPKTGRFINVPVDNYNHAIDGIRYVCYMELLGHANADMTVGYARSNLELKRSVMHAIYDKD